jgi:hypothetical protein
MDTPVAAQATRPRSTFVTVLAWIFIILSGFGTFVGVIENVMFFVFPSEQLNAVLAQVQDIQQMPPILRFAFSHIHGLVAGGTLFAVFSLVVSIGLLMRKNWARLAFVVIMALGIVWSLLSVAWQFFLLQGMPDMVGIQAPPMFRVMQTAIMAFSFVISFAFVVLYGWIIKKLLSERIRSEFTGG